MRLLNKILSLAASAAIMLTGYSTPASAKTDTVSSLEAVAGIQNTDVHFVKIAASWYHSLALDSDGHVWAWGHNVFCPGELATGRCDRIYAPERVKTDVRFIDIAHTYYNSFGIDENGHLWKWGFNFSGGDVYPKMIFPETTFKSVQGSYHDNIAIDTDGHVWVNGIKIESEKNFVSADVSYMNADGFVIDSEGYLYKIVLSHVKEDNRTNLIFSFEKVNFDKKVSKVSTNYSHNLLLDEDGYVWAWGKGGRGMIGDGTYEDREAPVRVKIDKKFSQIFAGNESSFAISQDGELYSWGCNIDKQLGGGELENNWSRNVPVQIMKDKKFKHVSAGDHTAFAIDDSDCCWGWGKNNYAETGIGTRTGEPIAEPTRMAINIKFTQISASGNHAAAVDTEGHVWIWGSDEHGESGTMAFKNKTGGIVITGSESAFFKEKITKVSVGDKHVLALDSNGHVWGWGSNQEGQLDERKPSDFYYPENLFAGTEYANLVFTDIYAGATSSMAVDSNGNTWQWGTGEAETPKSVDSGNDPGMPNTGLNFVQTAVGRDHRLCLDESGIVRSWGRNDYGQLGHCKDEKYCYPDDKTRRIDVYKIDVYKDDVKFAQVAAGDGFSVALDTEGRIWTWGRNDKGQLGNYVSASKRETPGYVFR